MADPTLWSYKTAHGDDAVTDRWEDIPLAQRAHAHPLASAPSAEVVALPAPHVDPLSFAGGLLVGAALALLLARRWRSAVIAVVVAGLALGGVSFYFGYLRRQAGLSSETLSSPQAIIGEVHDAAGAMKTHFGEQQRTLEQIEAGGK